MAGNLPLDLIQVTQTLLLKRFTVLHDRNFNLPQLLPAEKALELVEQNKGMFREPPCSSGASSSSGTIAVLQAEPPEPQDSSSSIFAVMFCQSQSRFAFALQCYTVPTARTCGTGAAGGGAK